jgi:hypothetical protein
MKNNFAKMEIESNLRSSCRRMCIMKVCVCVYICLCLCLRVRVRLRIYACVCGSHNLPDNKVGALIFGSSLRMTVECMVPNRIVIGIQERIGPRGSYHTKWWGVLNLRKIDQDVLHLRGLVLANKIERTKTGWDLRLLTKETNRG